MDLYQEIAPKTILCVQREEKDRRFLAKRLCDFKAELAATADEAWRAINGRGPFDAYILDFWLPDWDGASLCRAIRKNDFRTPIIFYTSAARTEDRRRALSSGADAYLGKPIDGARVLKQLQLLLELRDLASLRARKDEEHAIQEELERRAVDAFARANEARESARRAIERSAKIKAARLFIESGGTHANFERWWPVMFGSVWANAEKAAEG